MTRSAGRPNAGALLKAGESDAGESDAGELCA